MTSNKNRIRLSYSTLSLLNSCPRKFELRKVHPIEAAREESPPLSQGKAVGIGFQTYLETKNKDLAMLETWRGYYPKLEDAVRNTTKACVIVDKLISHIETNHPSWELALFNNKPAAELSFKIDLSDKFYYVGYLDAVVIDTNTNLYIPVELKTSSMYGSLKPIYQNSAQGLVYGIILDKILGENSYSFDILYLVAQVFRSKADQYKPAVHELLFTKSIVDRLEFLIDLKLSVERIERYMELDIFPKNGGSCMNFNKPCNFLDICGLATNKEVQFDSTEEEKIEYQFNFSIDELISDAMKLSRSL